MTDRAEIGVFGGSGFYALFDDVREIKVDTPYGAPSESVFLAEVGGRSVAFARVDAGQPDRPALSAPRNGPVIIEEYDSTCVVPPGWQAVLDPAGNIILTRRSAN